MSIKHLLLAAATVLFAGTAFAAAQFGTRAEAVAMVERAVELFETQGAEALKEAVADADNPQFHDRDLYVFMIGLDGIYASHGANETLVGQDVRGVKDASGFPVGLRLVEAAHTPEPEWVDYVWNNPVTGEEERKSSCIVTLDDTYFVGVGIYTDHQP